MEWTVVLLFALLVVTGLFVKGIAEEHRRRKKFVEDLKKNYGSYPQREYDVKEFESLTHYFRLNMASYDKGQQIDDITWNDLDMDNVFMSMDHTLSQTGEEYLYDMLRKPVSDEKEIAERDRVIRYFMDNEDIRLEYQKAFASMGRLRKLSMSDYLMYMDDLKEEENYKHYFCIVLGIAAIVLIFVNPPAGFAAFAIALIFNVATYFRRKGDIDPYITTFAYIIRMMRESSRLLKIDSPELAEYGVSLKKALNELKGLGRNTYILMSGQRMTGSLMELPLDYLRIFFHLDLIKFNSMLSIVRSRKKYINDIIRVTGFLDSCISIGAYRKSLKYWCVPERTDGHETDIRGLYHPLLRDPVPSDISTRKGILLTGSNASGKSTFLKAVALSVLMSETIATVTAESFHSGYFDIYSSMALRDDILSGESYYMVEIRSLKRILDAVQSAKEPVICFIDEVLRGTNTVERIAASSEILKSLTGNGVLTFAATHDIELTFMLEDYYDNYHFSEDVLENDIKFPYVLKKGRAESRNAIKLLNLMGYDEEITDAARNTAEKFTESGIWPKL